MAQQGLKTSREHCGILTHRSFSAFSWHDLSLIEMQENSQRGTAQEQGPNVSEAECHVSLHIQEESGFRVIFDRFGYVGHRRHLRWLIGQDMCR
jgi:hypothetical protein